MCSFPLHPYSRTKHDVIWHLWLSTNGSFNIQCKHTLAVTWGQMPILYKIHKVCGNMVKELAMGFAHWQTLQLYNAPHTHTHTMTIKGINVRTAAHSDQWMTWMPARKFADTATTVESVHSSTFNQLALLSQYTQQICNTNLLSCQSQPRACVEVTMQHSLQMRSCLPRTSKQPLSYLGLVPRLEERAWERD